MESVRSPGKSTFGTPRPRPGGPRRPTNFKSAPTTPLGLPSPSHSLEEAAPSYSGRESPFYGSLDGSHISSPVASSFEGPTDHSHLHTQNNNFRDQAVQVTPMDHPPTFLNSRPSTPSVSRSTTPAVKIIAKVPTLTPPPALNFESTPIAWRGMTLETAQWTLSSGELQEVVSRAIRRTAQESYIRLLSIKNIDEELKAELERLETLKATTQAQYRFNMHRRTNLLQSILALAGGEGDITALATLTTQLADITAACDKYMQELLRVADHKSQIQHVQDTHVSSALAMALRKLNASYAKRTTELRQSREQIDQLKGELEEAWKVAEDMAQEMDDLDNFQTGFSEDEDIDDDPHIDDSVRLAEVIGITGTAVAMKAKLTRLQTDTNKEREDGDHVRQRKVSAARKRSSRASKASLRIPKTPRKGAVTPDHVSSVSKVSAGSGHPPSVNTNTPPLPAINTDVSGPSKTPKPDSFLEMAPTRPVTPTTPEAPPPIPTNRFLFPTAQTDKSLPQPPPDPDSAPSKHLTLNFELPPINVYPAEDEPGSSGSKPNSRRVHSMQPSPVARTPPDDALPSGSSLKRSASDHRVFDGWPWKGLKHSRRRSMPLSGVIDEEDTPSTQQPEGRRSLESSRPTSLAPPPAHPPPHLDS